MLVGKTIHASGPTWCVWVSEGVVYHTQRCTMLLHRSDLPYIANVGVKMNCIRYEIWMFA